MNKKLKLVGALCLVGMLFLSGCQFIGGGEKQKAAEPAKTDISIPRPCSSYRR